MIAHLRARGAYCDICTACHIGDIDRVRELLDEDPSLANRVADYITYYLGSGAPLKNAAAKGHLEIVQLLLDRGADPNLREEGIAPHGHALYAAAANRHYEIAKLLLEHGAYPNPPVESSADALSRAISNSDQPMIDLLVLVRRRTVDGIARVRRRRAKPAAAALAANPALANDPDALANAAGEGHEAFVRLMLRYQPDLPQRVDFPSLDGRRQNARAERAALRPRNEREPARLARASRRCTSSPARETWKRPSNSSTTAPILHARDEDICSTPLGWAAKFGQKAMVELLLATARRRTCPTIHPGPRHWPGPLAAGITRSPTCCDNTAQREKIQCRSCYTFRRFK